MKVRNPNFDFAASVSYSYWAAFRPKFSRSVCAQMSPMRTDFGTSPISCSTAVCVVDSSPPTLAFSSPAMATRGEVLSLLRSILRAARRFPDYNVREYTKRRAIDGFRENKALSDASSIATAFADGVAQAEVARRQALVYSLYAPKVKSIMELEK